MTISDDVEILMTLHVDLDEPHVWMTARGDQDDCDNHDWEICGLYTKRERAVARCEYPADLVVALPLDVDFSNEKFRFNTEEWPLQKVGEL